MPLLLKKEISLHSTMAVWHISETEKKLSEMVSLSAEELSFLEGIRTGPRRLEWISSRVLLKEVCKEKDLKIGYNPFGKPFIIGSRVKISLSHSHSKVALIMSKYETGIDIELVKDKIVRIAGKFMGPAELKNIRPGSEAEQLTVYWCAKEALYKLYGKKELHFSKNIAIDDFVYSGSGTLSGKIKTKGLNRSFTLAYEKLRDFMLAYAVAE